MKTIKRSLSVLIAFILTAFLLIGTGAVADAFESSLNGFRRDYMLTGDGATDMVNIALAQNGRTQTQMGYGEPWCADFVSDCAILAGQAAAIPADGWCKTLRNNIINAGGSTVALANCRPGDLIFYDNPKNADPSFAHVEIITGSGSSPSSIGGNNVIKGVNKVYHRPTQNSPTLTVNCVVRPNYRTLSVPGKPAISMAEKTYKVGSPVTVQFGAWNGASTFEYYLTEYPEAYAYQVNTRHDRIAANAVTFTDLPAGRYSVFVHGVNAVGSSPQSNWLTFDVYDNDYVPVVSTVYRDHIYAVYDYEMSWTFAQSLCEDMGGDLVSIGDAEENDFIVDLIGAGKKDAYWIGTKNFSSQAVNQDGPWTWTTDEPFVYTNWYPGEPSGSGTEGTREHWAEIRKSYDGKWNDTTNINKANKGFILEIAPRDEDVTTQKSYDGKRYLLIDRNATWTEAEQYCKLKGGHLVTIDDPAEEAFVDSLIDEGQRKWYFVGAKRTDGRWLWSDGSEAQDIRWRGALWPEYCNYLMKYKDQKDYVNLPNMYWPADDMVKIGFVCEIGHQHVFDPWWSRDAEYHWRVCIKPSCGEIADKAAHIWDEGVVTKAPACTEKGEKTYTCAICGETKREEIPAAGHQLVHRRYEATCIYAGNEYDECTVCGVRLHESAWTPLGHIDEDGDGVCDRCDERLTSSVTEPPVTEPKLTEPPVTEPKPTEPPVTDPPAPAGLRGDANLDGKVLANDARLVLRASAKLETLEPQGFANCDLNGDGRLFAGEARKILRYSAKLEKEI